MRDTMAGPRGAPRVTAKVKIPGMIIAAAILLPAILPARADQPDYVGLSVNGDCKIGTCPPTAAQPNHGDATGFAFSPNASISPISSRTAIISASSARCGKVTAARATRPERSRSRGNLRATKTILQHRHRKTSSSFASFTSGIARPIKPRVAPYSQMYGAANRSSASWVNAVGEDTTSVTAGPHFAPTAFSETRQFTAPVRGNALAIGPIFTVIFGKESKSGAFIALSGAPNPTSDMTNARATPSLNVAATWIGSNFTMDTGRGGAQTEMVIHQDGDHVGTVYWLANAADPKAVASEQSWMRGTEAFREGNFNETMRHFQSGVESRERSEHVQPCTPARRSHSRSCQQCQPRTCKRTLPAGSRRRLRASFTPPIMQVGKVHFWVNDRQSGRAAATGERVQRLHWAAFLCRLECEKPGP
jgi:hypothetical protein